MGKGVTGSRHYIAKCLLPSCLIVIALVFANYYSAQAQVSTVLKLEQPPTSLAVGEKLIFIGYLATADDEAIEGATIEIYAYDESGNEVLLTTAVTNGDGEFQAQWISEDLADTLEILAYFAGEEGFSEAESEHYVVNLEQTEEQQGGPQTPSSIEVEISMNTEKNSYAISESVVVHGSVSEFVEDEEIYIAIYNPYHWLYAEDSIRPDSNGEFSIEFGIGGEYAVNGTWSIEASYLDSVATTEFEVTEEEGNAAEVAQEQTLSIEVNGQPFSLVASLSNGEIEEISPDEEFASLTINIQTKFYDGDLLITLPRDVLDAKSDDKDDDFIVLVDGDEVDYDETETSDSDRTLAIYVPSEAKQVEIIGTRLGSNSLKEVQTVLTLDPPSTEVVRGETVKFTGSIVTTNGEPIENALIWIVNNDEKGNDDELSYGLTDSNGRFEIEWLAIPTDTDNIASVYAAFDGGYDFEGALLAESASEQHEIEIIQETVEIEPEVQGAYMKLIGVWNKDPITVSVVNRDKRITEDYEQDVVFAFKEWSSLLKKESGNNKAWNFDIVKDSHIDVFRKGKPDILVDIKIDDEGTQCLEGGGITFGYAIPNPNPTTKKFEDTVPSVVFAGCGGEFFRHDIVRRTSIHELAHGFGIGHTFNKDGDLMCSVEEGVETCRTSGNESEPSKLNLDAVLFLYGKDGFAEPNRTPVPPIYNPERSSDFFYLSVSTDRLFYKTGETAKITVEVYDSFGNPVDVEPTLESIATKPTKSGVSKYTFDVNISGSKNDFVVKAGKSEASISIATKIESTSVEGQPSTTKPSTEEKSTTETPAQSAAPAVEQPSTSPAPSKCLIATAAFGSELAPQVQFLRNFRDNHILSTNSGSSFMNVFNAWYYSFSPYVADYERQQPWLQQTVKVLIYPLVGILQISEATYTSIDGEYGALAAGLVASSMIGSLYFSPLLLPFKQIRRNRFNYKTASVVVASLSVAVMASVAASNQDALMVTTSVFVLAVLATSAILVATTPIRVLKRRRNVNAGI